MGSFFHALAQQTNNMKLLVLAACVAVSAASNLVTHPNGAVTPVDEPAVALARAAHLNTKYAHGAYPYAFGGAYPYAFGGAYPYAFDGAYPYAYAGAHNYAYGAYPYAYGYPQALVAHPNGAVVPADEPAVAAAKADHFAAHGLPVAAEWGYHGLPYAGLAYAGLVAHPNGAVVPAEPADLVAARADHLAAHAAA